MGNQRGLGLHLISVCAFLFAVTYTCLGDGNSSVICYEKEQLALLKFKDSVEDPSGMLSSWVGNDCCLWEGIHCDSVTGNVESLYLRGSPRTGELYDLTYLSGNEVNSSLAELRHLKHLDLSGNYFGRSHIPEFIGSFKHLTYLNLSHARFGGIIPPHIGNLSNLKVLDLSWNSYMLSRTIFVVSSKSSGLMADDMAWASGLSSLEHLDLSWVNLSRVPDWGMVFYTFPLLNELSLSDCGLHKTHLSFPLLNFSTLSNIQHLDLSHNSIEGTFPSLFTNMTSLRVLDLSRNMLNSSVPVMPNLLDLDLSDNQFKQIGDVGIWRQCHLKQLHASQNDFEIEMINSPKNESECPQYALEWLDLSWCSNGTILEPLGRLTNLRGIDLSSSRLTGPIPESLERLTYLQVLDLSHNQLTGPIPTFLGNLSELYLSDNQLNGSIPDSIGNLAALTSLDLGYNWLTGPIPTSIGQLTRLYSLDFSKNSLEGVVFEAHFANLSKLESLDISFNTKLIFNVSRDWMPPFQLVSLGLSSCNIINGFPQWLRNQRKLGVLDLSNTTISGPLPTWLRKMPIIPHLDLSHNNLDGPLTNLPNGATYGETFGGEYFFHGGYFFHGLFLENNFFNGSIPRLLCRRTELGYLDLSRNMLTGQIPKCLENLQLLQFMILGSNRLSGVIPGSIALSSLIWLQLNKNNFVGEIPQDWRNLHELRFLDVGDNELSGNIPEWVGENLTDLAVLRLHNNSFTGILPESLCKASSLQILDVAQNNLKGHIPRCLGELNAMVNNSGSGGLNDFNNDENVDQVMKGVELKYTTTVYMVYNMDLSSNKLVGEIPVELTALVMLVGLNLSNNHLTGRIPDGIGKMMKLESLDLSGNELTGLIPPSMAALTFLSHLNLSNNNLSGRIPTGSQLQTLTDPSIYSGNEDLCGAPLPNNCSNSEEPTTRSKKKHRAADEQTEVWLFYVDIICGFATGFWGIIGVLLFKRQWRQKLFMFAEEMMDRIYVAVMVRVAKIKRGREAE